LRLWPPPAPSSPKAATKSPSPASSIPTPKSAPPSTYLRYGYFFWDYISIGLQGGISDNDAATAGNIGITAEYNLPISDDYEPLIGTDFVPYFGGAISYQHAEIFGKKANAAVFTGEVGLKFFLTDTAAFTTSFLTSVATEDVYADDMDKSNIDLSLRLGMRFYF